VAAEIKNKDIVKRPGTNINIEHRMMDRKLNFFSRRCRTQDDRLIKQEQEKKDMKEMNG